MCKSLKRFDLFFYIFLIPTFLFADIKIKNESLQEGLSIVNSKISYTKEKDYNYISCVGSIKNSSTKIWNDIVIEIQFFDNKGEMIDTITRRDYDLVIPSNETVTFKVTGDVLRQENEYAKHQVRIISAREAKKCSSKSGFTKLFIELLPVFVILLIFIYFARKPQNKIIQAQEEQIKLIGEQNQIFREIADAIKKEK